jgi:hypothetical protein
VNFPVADALQPGEAFFGGFDRPFRGMRGADHDRALATPEQPIVSRDFVEKTNAIAGHRAIFLPALTRSLGPSRFACDDLDQNPLKPKNRQQPLEPRANCAITIGSGLVEPTQAWLDR